MSERRCQVEGCDASALARGLCSMHYRRLLAHGDVHRGRQPRTSPRCSAEGCKRFASRQTGLCKLHAQAQQPHRDTCWRCWEVQFALTTGLGYAWLLDKGVFSAAYGITQHIRAYLPELADRVPA